VSGPTPGEGSDHWIGAPFSHSGSSPVSDALMMMETSPEARAAAALLMPWMMRGFCSPILAMKSSPYTRSQTYHGRYATPPAAGSTTMPLPCQRGSSSPSHSDRIAASSGETRSVFQAMPTSATRSEYHQPEFFAASEKASSLLILYSAS